MHIWDVHQEGSEEHSHSSLHFEGADAVHEGCLLSVFPGHKVLHAGGDGSGLPTEVRFVVDHQLKH